MKMKHLITILICCVSLFILSSCGSDGDIEVSIADGQFKTIIEAFEGETIESILERADITINEGDIVTPELDQTIESCDKDISIERCAEVTVQTGDKEKSVTLTGGTVGDAIDELDITIEPNDFVNHSMSAYLTSGMNILIQKRYEINISVDGKDNSIVTAATTVNELLDQQGIKIGKDDRVSPSLKTALHDNMDVVVKHVTTDRITVDETIAYSTVYESSSSMYVGDSSVKQAGQDGQKRVTYNVTYVGGVEESREVVSSTVTKEAVNQIVVQGTKQKASSSSGSSSKSGGKSVVSKEKVYDCDGSGHGYYVIKYSDGSVSYQDF